MWRVWRHDIRRVTIAGMAIEWAIHIDLKPLLTTLKAVDGTVFPMLHQAVERVAQQAVMDWKDAVYHAPLWEGEKDAYYQSITYRMNGDFSAEVFSDYQNAEAIESGRPARDLKTMLDTSMKVRLNKKGQRYLIIPMRHGAPGSIRNPMPANIYAQAKELSPSMVTGSGMRPSGTGAMDTKTKQPVMVRSRKYLWGENLPAGLAPKLRPSHATDIYAGMRRFDTKSGGKSARSSFMTFRIMGEWQIGKWIVGPKPGLFIAKGVAERIQPLAGQAFMEGMQRDLDKIAR